jgi:hypothetical protein
MTYHNAPNERIKRQYFAYLAEAQGYSEQSIDPHTTSRIWEYQHARRLRYRQQAQFIHDPVRHHASHWRASPRRMTPARLDGG